MPHSEDMPHVRIHTAPVSQLRRRSPFAACNSEISFRTSRCSQFINYIAHIVTLWVWTKSTGRENHEI